MTFREVDPVDDYLAPARPTLARTLQIVSGAGLRYVDLGEGIVGVGAAVPFGPEAFSVVSVAAGGNEGTVNLTIGVLKDVRQDRLAVLDECNSLTQDNAAYPYYLHDAEIGWDVLLQVRLPITVVNAVPAYFLALLQQLPGYSDKGREKISAVVGGKPYQWNQEDCQRLLLRSLM
ncbi:hypothetical protein [Micromonospora psammae]|uniref:hypothetical protein n=1 Tax=Micromonospora sp. CPCC 205556 TaxID=3122398 RepID=UPI002FF188EF